MRFFFYLCILYCPLLKAQIFNAYDKDGKRHGKWKKMFEKSDQIRYEGTFDHGKEIGTFKFYKPDSGIQPTATKLFSKTNDTVLVKYFTRKGNVISEGKMVKKNRIGLWKYYHQNSTKIMMTESYDSGKLQGKQSTYFKSGRITEATFYNQGKKVGKSEIFSEDGVKIKEFTYKNDLLHGPTKYYNTKGTLMIEGNYNQDRKKGVWKYYKNGKLEKEVKFPKQK